MQAITIGLDIAKSIFQVHSEDASGKIVLQKRLRRGQVASCFAKLAPARVGIEACGSAHWWGRTLRGLGHEVQLLPAAGACPRAGASRTVGQAVCPPQQDRRA
jgi:transposase